MHLNVCHVCLICLHNCDKYIMKYIIKVFFFVSWHLFRHYWFEYSVTRCFYSQHVTCRFNNYNKQHLKENISQHNILNFYWNILQINLMLVVWLPLKQVYYYMTSRHFNLVIIHSEQHKPKRGLVTENIVNDL